MAIQPINQNLSMGSIQNDFVYSLRQFMPNQQFTIVEDMPKNKIIRKTTKISPKTGGSYTMYKIRITSGGFEADLDLMSHELSAIAVACPKSLDNFKGATLAFDGQRWVYICSDAASNCNGNGQQPQSQAPPQQPNEEIGYRQLAEAVILSQKLGFKTDGACVIKIADSLKLGDALALIAKAKNYGWLIEEADGTYRGVV